MKKLLLTTGLLGVGMIALLASDPTLDVEKKPLPGGPLLNQAPAFSRWQIMFSYASDKSAAGDSVASPTTPAGNGTGGSLPRLLTVTLTRPLWHGVVVAVDGGTTECWYDGHMPFEIGEQKIPMGLNMDTPGAALPHFLDYRGNTDFPDIGWVSAQTYLGSQKGTTYWVFQQQETDGATVWIDSNTRFPVRWRKGDESRVFKFLPAPSERLTLPADVDKLSKEQAHIRYISTGTAPRGA